MTTLANIDEVKNQLTLAQEILILTHETPNQDSLGASLALFLALQVAGKKVTVGCPTAPTVEFNNLVGLDKLVQELPSKNFVISLDYIEGAIEKVSYNIEGDRFNLVIQPKAGAPSLRPEQIHYRDAALNPDLIFILDCLRLEQLTSFYQNKDLYSQVAMINIDYHPENALFGKINLVDKGASSTSEITTFLLQELGLPFNQDIGSNLLAGLVAATDNFSLDSPGAFEAAAICLKVGGKRRLTTQPVKTAATPPADWLQPKIFKSSAQPQRQPPKDEQTLL